MIISLLFGGMGLLVHHDKDNDKRLVQQPLAKHVLQCLFTCAGLISELILAYFLLSSQIAKYMIPGLLLIASRFVIAPYPTVMVVYQLTRSTKPLIDPENGEMALRYYVESKKLFKSSKIYTVLFILAFFDPLLLSFLPWYNSSFSEASFFPTLSNMKMCLSIKLLQLLVTFVAQIMVIMYDEHQRTGKNFRALLYLNLALSGLVFFVKMFEAYMRRGVLAGSRLSEESEAANEAAREQSVLTQEGDVSSSGETSNAALPRMSAIVELGDIYPSGPGRDTIPMGNRSTLMEENPMHTAIVIEQADARETDTLLMSRISNLEERIESLENSREQ